MEYLDEYARWINEADPETVAELESIKDDDAEIKAAFIRRWSLEQPDLEAFWAPA